MLKEAWFNLAYEEDKLADWRTELNQIIQKSGCTDARFMQEREAARRKEIKAYRVKLNEYFMKPQIEYEVECGTPQSGVVEESTAMSAQFREDEEQVVQQEVMQFEEDGGVEKVESNDVPEFDDYPATGDTLENSVRTILERPTIIEQGTWTQAQTPGAGVTGMTLPRSWFGKKQVKSKLEGFRFLRCDFRARLQVNSQPFNAGCLIMTFIPFHGQLANPPEAGTGMTFPMMTGYRHVYLDLSTSTTCEMVIPYICPESHFDLTMVGGLLGVVRAFVYSPLTGGTNDVEFTLYVNAENIEVQMPGPYGIKAPMEHGVPQAGFTDKEKKKGTVSQIAGAVSGIANTFKGVPGIGAIASSVGTVSDIVGGVASMFGFSKPTYDPTTTAVQGLYVRNMANTVGDSKAKSLGLIPDNHVTAPASNFQTTEDEMSLTHILSQWIYLARFSMSTANAPGTNLFQFAANPTLCEVKQFPGPPVYEQRNNTYASYLANMFKYYRGGLEYNFRIVKTCFHSGRIRVYFVPTGAVVSTPLTAEEKEMCYSKIIDFKDKTDFTITIPYLMNIPWLPCAIAEPSNFNYGATGRVFVEVLNALRAPSTVGDSIEFIVETRCAPDFQFANYGISKEYRSTPPDPALEYGSPQAGTDLFSATGMSDQKAHLSTVGEVITSLRQVLKRYTEFALIPVTTTGVLDPWEAIPKTTNLIRDPYSLVQELYRFYSGSMRILSVISTNNSSSPVYFGVIYQEPNPADVQTTTPIGSGKIVQNVIQEPTMEIEIPYYGITPATLTPLGSPIGTDIPCATTDMVMYPRNRTKIEIITGHELLLFRQIGEDFSFGYLVAPPITYNYA